MMHCRQLSEILADVDGHPANFLIRAANSQSDKKDVQDAGDSINQAVQELQVSPRGFGEICC